MCGREVRGQEAIEFVLIVALVFFAALFTVLIFGSTISSFFGNKSNIANTANNKALMVNGSSVKDYQQSYNYLNAANTTSQTLAQERTSMMNEIEAGLPGNSSSITMPDVVQNEDASITFTAGNQTITLPPAVNDLSNKMFQTTGSSGVPDIVKEITYMIQTHQAEFTDKPVPVEVSFGTGDRSLLGEGYAGQAAVNSTTVKVGDHIVIIQKDHSCKNLGQYDSYCSSDITHGRMGKLRIEGKVDPAKRFKGKITSIEAYKLNNQTYDATYNNGSMSGKFFFPGDDDGGSAYGNWNFNFTNSANKFNI